MKQNNKYLRHFPSLAVLLLFAVYGFLAIVLVALGAKTYANVLATMHDNAEIRTTLQYIYTRAAQTSGERITLIELEGRPALALEEVIEGESYLTYLFYQDGYLMELFTKRGSGIGVQGAQPIAAVGALHMEEIEEGLYAIEVTTAHGTQKRMLLCHDFE